MKKIIIGLLFMSFFVTGCFEYNVSDITKDIDKKYGNLKSYKITGTLEIINNDDVYNYDVTVSYQKKDKFKVNLKNTSNQHEQIILKNEEGVYVLTPSLNKSFKFQSEWPYNNSQVYLLQSIITDLKSDEDKDFTTKEKEYIITSKVNYPNNRKLVKQIITLDKDLKINKVSVVDENEIAQMTMIFDTIDTSPSYEENYFDLDSIMDTTSPKLPEANSDEKTSSLDETIYPLYIPTGTQLTNEETIAKDDGERKILTFDGEKPFLLVEETASIPNEFSVIPTYGEPYLLIDTVGALSDNSITWSSSGVDYYLVSEVMSQDELLDIARSVNTLPMMK